MLDGGDRWHVMVKIAGSGRRSSTFLATTDVGRTAGPPVAEDEEAAASDALEWRAGNARSVSL